MHFWAFKTQKLPGPLRKPWTLATNGSLHSWNLTSLCQQLWPQKLGPSWQNPVSVPVFSWENYYTNPTLRIYIGIHVLCYICLECIGDDTNSYFLADKFGIVTMGLDLIFYRPSINFEGQISLKFLPTISWRSTEVHNLIHCTYI